MAGPPLLVTYEALIVSCAACALPAAVVGSGSAAGALFGFFVVAFLVGVVLGLPAYWLLAWRKAASARNCAMAGVLVAAVFYAFFTRRISGPGVDQVQTLVLSAISGGTIGFLFRTYLGWRVGDAEPLPAAPRSGTAPIFVDRFGNQEMFAWFRRGPSGSEYLRHALARDRPIFEARRVEDLSITITADPSAGNRYLLCVRNRGARAYEALRVHYELLLLNAESFGEDTTHMPPERAQAAGEPVVIDRLEPGATARIVRAGYGLPTTFDGPRETAFDLEFRCGAQVFRREDRRWGHVIVKLP